MADTMQEFLIALGFRVDPAQQNRFEDALKSSHDKVSALGKGLSGMLEQFASLATAATGTAIGLAAALTKIASEMAQLKYASDRVGSAPQNIRALEYSLKQIGGTAEEARGALEQLAAQEALRPGLLQTFNIAEGTDLSQAMLQLADRWRGYIARNGKQGLSQAIQEGTEALHLPESFVRRLIQNPDVGRFFNEELQRQAQMRLNLPDITKLGQDITREITRLEQRFNDFGLFMFNEWGPKLDTALSRVNNWFEIHTPQIERYLHGLRTDFDAFTGAVSGWYNSLSPVAQDTVERAGMFVAGAVAIRQVSGLLGLVGRIVGLGSLATPVGQLIALAGAIGGLAFDYNRWKESGGKDSIIDWSGWEGPIESAKAGLGQIAALLSPLIDTTLAWKSAQQEVITFMATFLLPGVLGPLARVLQAANLIKDAFEAAAGAVERLIFGSERAQQAERLRQLGPFPTQNQLDWAMKGLPGEMPQSDPNQGGIGGWWNRNMPSFLGGTGGRGGATDARKAQVRDQLSQELQIPPNAAAGLVSNLNAESGIAGINERNPVVPGSRGGFGWAQWTGPRRIEFEQYARQNNLDPASDEANRGFLIQELRTKYPQVLAKLRRGDISAVEAARIVADEYIIPPEATRPGHAADADRISRLTAPRPPLTQEPAVANGAPALTPSPAAYNTTTTDQSKEVTLNAPSTINITGVSDPDRAAELVGRRQQRENANLLRHLGTAYS